MATAGRGRKKGPRMISEIERLRKLGLSKRKIAKALGCSRNTIDKYLDPGTEAQIASEPYQAPWSDQVDWSAVKTATDQGVPLFEHWEEYVHHIVPYVSFWREYRRRYPNVPLDLHKVHPPGERCEIDYKGDAAGLGYTDRRTGEYIPCKLFGAICCFSQLFFPYATRDEKQPSLLRATSKAYEYFGGVPLTTAFDNAKASVTKPHIYDPEVNREFALFLKHFGTAPMPTRPRKPKDKNLIENALGVFWRWARRRIRSQRFFSIGELNSYLNELADLFNSRVQRKYGLSRRDKFERGERDKLLDLPDTTYSFGEWKSPKVHADCHIQIKYNFYSVPHHLRGVTLDARISQTMVEVFHNLERVACHLLFPASTKGRYSTKKEHQPPAHQAVNERLPQYVLAEAEDIGPNVHTIIKHLILESTHPLMYVRRCQGILRLAKRYSRPALDQACAQIVSIGRFNPLLKDIEEIIRTNINPRSATVTPIRRGPNPFIRGQESWSQNTNKGDPES